MSSRFPAFLRKSGIYTGRTRIVESLLSELELATVCQSARCPNRNECFASGTATFLLMGKICARNCAFCAIDKGVPEPLDPHEPEKIARAAQKLSLKHVVLTSVTRDDLEDGGASHFRHTIEAVRNILPVSTIEALIPDFKGNLPALHQVLYAEPDILNHNMETVPRLYPAIRAGADYERSLLILSSTKKSCPEMATKSGLMLGMGETKEEVIQTMKDLRRVDCEILTLGQYLTPGRRHFREKEFITPDCFRELKDIGLNMGFIAVEAGPFVRSSFHAHETWRQVMSRRKERK
ncbi:lipoyl synthase [Candidatus Sumerlaeota bacterium]|nr:lipoyl synthase [Candidatus Sumerlaeota bacterium]